ncbi:methylated-DNA--[protein]-cysteine S-methyltransferase [Caldisalinibacter kiritimatiensis]|uniref:Methylated-DNA--protein-cysteine methyltransferase n=1 Tax=Caldisalinibacter kiritimatiensis TaxID=1304284 RepID=R1ARU4_9FIRM|nr:methylated-DNA--[protein]-cysteine S-methyltransferase [Caldisalinibacter kiritimatiensis]EOC99867.1 Methylated-DNA--protein-cysteine methyltransferase [Caldisalinibacter kiritimatiensis]
MYKKIEITKRELEHLKSCDKNMRKLIEYVGDIERYYIEDPFLALINSIVFQQLAYNAANAIWNRFLSLYDNITPEKVINTEFDTLRKCGLSKTKIEYIKNICRAIINNELDIENIDKLSDEQIIDKLVKIKGIGIWTAEMFLLFSLNRRNVLSYKDLGIRKGIKWLFNMKKEPTKDEFEKIKEKFSPYNTVASLYLWEITSRGLLNYDSTDILDRNIGYFDSPLGLIELQSKDGKLVSLDFAKEKVLEEKLDSVLEKTKQQLKEYFTGKRKKFDIPIELNGTDFQKRVWKELMNISYGKTLTYKEVAVNIGNKNASRAVGNANNKNKIAIIIPCHRVIGSSGKLIGYEGGLWRKKWLLQHEQQRENSSKSTAME